MNEIQHFRCRAAHICDNSANVAKLEYIPDAIISVRDGKIDNLCNFDCVANLGIRREEIIDKRSALMLPGFIDAHVHAPQLNMIGAYGKQLLDWLNNYTFPMEARFADEQYSKAEMSTFLDALIAHGTTTAFVFATSHTHSAEHLFDAAKARGMCLITGKVLMDRNAPANLLDCNRWPKDVAEQIESYHGNDRLGYAITPRFAGTSTPNQLKVAGELLHLYPELWLQTHLSENLDEIEWTKSLFPEAQDYLDVYEQYKLHGEKSIFAHCIHLSESELGRIADTGSTVAFCPSSNLFLGSGLLNLTQLHEREIPYALATDIGAGTSLSQFETMGDAYKVAQLGGYSFGAEEALYSATLGAAKALKLDSQIGNLAKGKYADFIFVESSNNKNIQRRLDYCNSIEEELFVYMTMGDDRIIQSTYIRGTQVYVNPIYHGEITR